MALDPGVTWTGAALPTAVPAAVSPLSAGWLGAASRPARVLAAFPTALYLALDRHERVLPVLTRDALLLPTGLRLAAASGEVSWGVVAGDEVEVGEGRVVLPQMTVRGVRRWRPSRVDSCASRSRRRTRPEGVRLVLAAAVGDAPLRSLSAEVAHAALAAEDVRPALRAMLGAGQGLTPSADDALCGALLTLRGAGVHADLRGPLYTATLDALTGTTSLSASLLGAAVDGYAVPEVSRLVRAATAGHEAAVTACLPGVLGIGHTSGVDLAGGVLGALEALAAVETVEVADSHGSPVGGRRPTESRTARRRAPARSPLRTVVPPEGAPRG